MIQPPPPPHYGMTFPPPAQNMNGQPNMNFSAQPMQNMPNMPNMVPSMKDSFQGNMEPAMMPGPPPGGQGGNHANTEYVPKFGMGRHLYSGKIPDMGSDGSMGGPGGMQTMLLPSNADSAGHQPPVRPGLVQPASDALLGLHITQLGGLNASQLEGMESAVTGGPGGSPGPGLGRKLPSGASPNIDGFSMHHLQVDGPNSIGGGGGGTEGVAPIGTERAQKATMSAYPITPAIAPGFMRSVWSYSGGQGTYVGTYMDHGM